MMILLPACLGHRLGVVLLMSGSGWARVIELYTTEWVIFRDADDFLFLQLRLDNVAPPPLPLGRLASFPLVGRASREQRVP
jgi:hypothetical protein